MQNAVMFATLFRAFRKPCLWVHDAERGEWTLRPGGVGTRRALVWPNGTWQTYSRGGSPGETGAGTSVAQAKLEAMTAAERQGFI